jgi:hypothetical protein
MLRQLDDDPLRAADVAAALSWAIGAGGRLGPLTAGPALQDTSS